MKKRIHYDNSDYLIQFQGSDHLSFGQIVPVCIKVGSELMYVL
jgi:hypothetical protein